MNFTSHIRKYKSIRNEDHRGYLKILNEDQSKGISLKESFSVQGVFRGMHIQVPPFDQVKNIQVISGKLIDYVLVLDQKRADYGKIYSKEIDAGDEVYVIPNYCAHGIFAVEPVLFRYLCIGKYSEDHEASIKGPLSEDLNAILSEKDVQASTFQSQAKIFSAIDWET
jgi:dTDP-4-dehydrorhamnose 3,5-epimerase